MLAAMHEMGLAVEVYRAARKAADSAGGGVLESVTVDVGELSAVEPDLLGFAWEALLSGTPDSGARLRVDWHPARQDCARCGDVAERAAGSWLRLCPRCGEPLRISGGEELELRTVAFTGPASALSEAVP
jgi:hydrogenase nickel incorporation protein HypA/HybF